MSDIQEWIKKIERGIWDGLASSSKDVMDVWAVFMVSRMKSDQGYKATAPPSIKSGRLARAIQGMADSSDGGVVDDNAIVYERTLKIPYAWMLEKGGNINVTDRMKKMFLWKYSQTKEKKWAYMAFAKTLNHPALNYIQDSITGMSVEKIEAPIRRHLETELNKIPNLEVTIGVK
uniref:Uncharacterized protein n=1 Tax=viral metagenome TaxID=1070528 RepID=A0A6M3IY43_9ZZZZ